MAVPLTTTLNATRAHIAAGVLEAHGIPAWVEHDLITGWYPIPALGGVNLMVNKEDVEAAREVLNTLPPEPEKAAATEPVQTEPGVSLAESIGTGLLHGLWGAPVLMIVMNLLDVLMTTLANTTSRGYKQPIPVAWVQQLPAYLVGAAMLGAVCGIVAGIAAWLLASYRYRHRAGVIFVFLVALMCSNLLEVILFLLVRLLEL